MFRDCGWEYLQDYVGFSYFRKPASEMKDDEGIFCDDASRREMMMRVFKGRVRPLIAIFLLLLLPRFALGWPDVPDAWDAAARILWGAVILLYGVVFVNFAVQYWKIRK